MSVPCACADKKSEGTDRNGSKKKPPLSVPSLAGLNPARQGVHPSQAAPGGLPRCLFPELGKLAMTPIGGLAWAFNKMLNAKAESLAAVAEVHHHVGHYHLDAIEVLFVLQRGFGGALRAECLATTPPQGFAPSRRMAGSSSTTRTNSPTRAGCWWNGRLPRVPAEQV